ncbi:hypothetical protein HAX54_052851 [Datura stramonium]|uniref:Uncharacterized protein n=1 Tax=Datura stramonium TaxID=4076 RepID=A0ABS8T0B3_DATST|nr:hypothetical protein [Datura stramonium]
MENHHHNSEALLASSLQGFRSDKCLDVIPLIHRAFATLVVEIDHPMNRWGKSQVEDYLDYSLNLLAKNSVTSGFERDSAHDLGREFKVEVKMITENEESSCCGKDVIIRRSLWILWSISLWVFGVLLIGICSSVKPYMELRKSAGLFDDSLIRGWDTILANEIAENCGVSKEVKEINEVATSLKAAVANGEVDGFAIELRRRLEGLEGLLQTI